MMKTLTPTLTNGHDPETIPVTHHCYTWGGSGEVMMLLHGFTGSGESWAEHGEGFARAGFRVLAPDLLGHGRSPAPADPRRYAMMHAAADLAALIRTHAHGAVHLLGYSMGGRLALHLALTHPELVRSLVLESASPGLAGREERAARKAQDEALALRIEKEGVPAFVDFWERLPLWRTQARLDQETRDKLRAQRLRNRALGLANSLRGMGTGVQPNLWPYLPALLRPTLLLVGAEDAKFVEINRRMVPALPQARLAVIPEAGHTVHLEAPAAFQAHVLDFIAGQSG